MLTIVITGTTRGLGKAMLDLLAKAPHSVIAIARRRLPEQSGYDNVRFLTVDLSHPEAIHRDLDWTVLLSEDCDEILFIDNAATLGAISSVGQLEEQTILNAINVNFIAPIFLTNALCRVARKRGAALRILHISSGAAQNPIEGWSLYGSTKAAISMFYRVAGEEGLSTSVVDPGVIDTDMQRQARDASPEQFPMRERFVQLYENEQLQDAAAVARRLLSEQGVL